MILFWPLYIESARYSKPGIIKMKGLQLLCIIRFFMQRSLVKSVSLFQSSHAHLNSYDRQYRCEKQIPYDIRDKSILLLDHQGACM